MRQMALGKNKVAWFGQQALFRQHFILVHFDRNDAHN